MASRARPKSENAAFVKRFAVRLAAACAESTALLTLLPKSGTCWAAAEPVVRMALRAWFAVLRVCWPTAPQNWRASAFACSRGVCRSMERGSDPHDGTATVVADSVGHGRL